MGAQIKELRKVRFMYAVFQCTVQRGSLVLLPLPGSLVCKGGKRSEFHRGSFIQVRLGSGIIQILCDPRGTSIQNVMQQTLGRNVINLRLFPYSSP